MFYNNEIKKMQIIYDDRIINKLFYELKQMRLTSIQTARILGYLSNYLNTIKLVKSVVSDINFNCVVPTIFPLPDFRYRDIFEEQESNVFEDQSFVFNYSNRINRLFKSIFPQYFSGSPEIYFISNVAINNKIKPILKNRYSHFPPITTRKPNELLIDNLMLDKILLLDKDKRYFNSFKKSQYLEAWVLFEDEVVLNSQNGTADQIKMTISFKDLSAFFNYIIIRHKINIFTNISNIILGKDSWKVFNNFDALFSEFVDNCEKMNFSFQFLFYYYGKDLFTSTSSDYNLKFLQHSPLSKMNQTNLISAINLSLKRNMKFISYQSENIIHDSWKKIKGSSTLEGVLPNYK